LLYTHLPDGDIFSPIARLSNSISRLVSTDTDLFREAFRKEPTYYCNNWLYILRSTRDDHGNFGYKFVGKDVLIGIGYRNQIVYLVHPMGKDRFAATLALCQNIQHSMRCSIVLKKIDQELYEYLRSSNLFQKQNDASIPGDETFLKYPRPTMLLEEETFPEHMLDLSALYNSVTGSYNQSGPFIRKVMRFEKSAIKLLTRRDCVDVENTPGFFTLFAPNSEKYKSYLQMIREVGQYKQGDDRYKVCAYYDEHKILHGLYISEVFREENMGLYCAVSSRAFPGITEWMDHNFFQQLYQSGIHYLYLGGSETPGVNSYVKKLFPTTPPYLLQSMQIDSRDEISPDVYVTSAD
jgi:hypothetical protein